jgi:hypothetical protein
MQLALLGFVLPNQVGNAVLGELVGDVPGECIVVHYLLIQLSAFFAHETLPIREKAGAQTRLSATGARCSCR